MNKLVDRGVILPLIAIVSINSLLHVNDFPAQISLIIISLLSWRVACFKLGYKLPGKWLRVGLVIAISYFIAQQFSFIWSDEIAIAMLAAGVSLKLLESIQYRDVMVVLLMCFYLLMSKLLSSQSFAMTVFLIVDVALIMAIMFRLHVKNQDGVDFKQWLRPAAKIIIKATPLIIALFFIFPRISTSLLGVNQPQQSQIGFSDRMNPGDVSEIAGGNETAFRVQIKNHQLNMMDSYWRGSTLNHTFGLRWKKGTIDQNKSPIQKSPNTINQEIVLEPLFGNLLFALDKPENITFRDIRKNKRIKKASDHTFTLKNIASQRVHMLASSSLTSTSAVPSEEYKNQLLSYPKELSEKLKSLAVSLGGPKENVETRANRLMQYFKTSGMRYTLKPGRVKSLDDLIFNSKKGFCEHFAAAFATLMRANGVMSRVVLGFQGGRQNPIDGYYVITQRDAHAWVEIWSAKKSKWLRYDPTEVISPLRIELGGQQYFELDPLQQGLTSQQLNTNKGFLATWLEDVAFRYDAFTHRWNLFLLNYDVKYQEEIFGKLGKGKLWQFMLFLISLTSVVAFYFLYKWYMKNFSQRRDPVQAQYKKLYQFLGEKGVQKKFNEGPLEYLNRCKEKWPENSTPLNTVFETYIKSKFTRYQAHSDDSKHLTSALKQLKQNWL